MSNRGLAACAIEMAIAGSAKGTSTEYILDQAGRYMDWINDADARVATRRSAAKPASPEKLPDWFAKDAAERLVPRQGSTVNVSQNAGPEHAYAVEFSDPLAGVATILDHLAKPANLEEAALFDHLRHTLGRIGIIRSRGTGIPTLNGAQSNEQYREGARAA